MTGSAATRAYRCPGCQQAIRPATPHVVVWPVEPSLLAASAGETGLASVGTGTRAAGPATAERRARAHAGERTRRR